VKTKPKKSPPKATANDSPQEAAMRSRGFVRMKEAAALSKSPLTNLYRLVKKGALEHEIIGDRTVFVKLDSLRERFASIMGETI
jgi:hypothetical protein